MLWKLTKFELKKLTKSKFFLIALALLLLANMALCMPSFRDWTYFGSGREAVEYWRKEYNKLNSLSAKERADFEAAMTQKYGEDVFSPFFPLMPEMNELPGYFGDEFPDANLISDISILRQQNEQLHRFRDEVIHRAKFFGREAILSGNKYEIRRNLEILSLYSAPVQEQTSAVRGWQEFLSTNTPILISLLLILLLCAGIFTKEKEQGTWPLLETAKNGQGKTLIAKYLAGGIAAAGITLLTHACALLMISLNFGLLGGNQPFYAIQPMELFPFSFTFWQYTVLSVLCKVFAAVIASILLCAISSFSKNSVISYGVGAVVLGGFILLTLFPPVSEWLAGPLALTRTDWYFDTYYTANIFSYPMLWAVVQAVLWSVLAFGVILLSHKVHHRKRSSL